MKLSFKHIIAFFFLVGILASCKINYSLTGTSIAPDVKTFSVQDFPNRAPMYVPTLSQSFTEKLKDKLLSQTSLQIVTSGVGDLDYAGEITGYKITPIAVSGNETASQNRLTISVKLTFTNTKDPKQDFVKTFSNYADFDATESIEDIEQDLIDQILEKITEDIFNNSVANW